MNNSKHKNFYQKYRPSKFSEIWSQKEIISILKEQIIQKKLHHAYIFCGSHGIGKTSAARIFAKAIICLDNQQGEACGKCRVCILSQKKSMDIQEIDAASNNGIEDIRNLQEKIFIAPIIANKKIWIIDEVHMFSRSAFNAFLKILEEPPKHVIFILATTEPHKIPATVLSRGQIFNFFPLQTEEMSEFLLHIAKLEGIDIELGATVSIAMQTKGSVRTALNILEQMFFLQKGTVITKKNVSMHFGEISDDMKIKFISYLIEKNVDNAMKLIDKAARSGINIIEFVKFLIKKIHEILLKKIQSDGDKLSDQEKKWKITQLQEILKYLIQDFFSLLNQKIDSKSVLEIVTFKITFNENKILKDDRMPVAKILKPIKINIEKVTKILKNHDTKSTKSIHSQWKNLSFYLGQKNFSDYISELNKTKVISASANVILLKAENRESATIINSWKNEKKLQDFFQLFFGSNKTLTAITEQELKQIKESFYK